MKNEQCRCKSGKLYRDCCQKYHQGALPENALALMRSRYSAYALGLVDYIIETTHPINNSFLLNRKKWAEDIKAFSSQTDFENLDILDHQENPEESTVTFVAHLKQGGQDMTFTEKSTFKQKNGRWLYFNGNLAKGCLSAEQAKKL